MTSKLISILVLFLIPIFLTQEKEYKEEVYNPIKEYTYPLTSKPVIDSLIEIRKELNFNKSLINIKLQKIREQQQIIKEITIK